MTVPDLQRVASAYSPTVLRALGSAVCSEAVVLPRIKPIVGLTDGHDATLADAFTAGERLLRQRYRNEYIYKNDLVSRVVFGRHSPRTTSALLEVPMGNSCADVMVVNGTSTIYEIKTDLDQLDRLSTQLLTYVTRAEYVHVVAGERRVKSALARLPRNVGLLVAKPNGSMSVVKRAESNLHNLDADHLFQLLRIDEALTVLNRVSGYTLDVPRGHAWKRMRELFTRPPVHVLHQHVVDVLKDRGKSAAAMTTHPKFPPALRALAYTAARNPTSTARTHTRLAIPLREIGKLFD